MCVSYYASLLSSERMETSKRQFFLFYADQDSCFPSLSLPFCDLFLLLNILTCVVGSHSFGYMSSFHYLAPRILESKAYLHVSLKTCTRICDAERHTRGLGGGVCVEEAGLISQKRDEEYKRIPTYLYNYRSIPSHSTIASRLH